MNDPYRARRPAEFLSGTLFLDLGGGPRDAVLLAGSGRSGTTWLSELINRENEFRFIFEPFPRKQYLRPEDDRVMHLEAAEKILSGKTRSRWADKFNRKIIARRRLIKDIRANLILGWTRRHFPETSTILLLRHPCAVADSRLRLGWRDNLDEVMSQKQLVEDHLPEPLEAEILAAKDPFERSILLWCIENYVPLRQPGSEKLHTVFYEKLLTDPERELASISHFLEESPPDPRTSNPRRPAPPRTPGASHKDDPMGDDPMGDDPMGDDPMGRLQIGGGSRVPGFEPRSEPENPVATRRDPRPLRTGDTPPEGESHTSGHASRSEPRSEPENPSTSRDPRVTGECPRGDESGKPDEKPNSPPGSEARRIYGWTERVDAARRKRAVEIMELFGMDRIYGYDPMPRPEGVPELWFRA